MKFGRCLVIAGGVILLIGGLLHSYGYHFLEPKLTAVLGTTPELLGVVKALWWAFAVEFVILGVVVIWAARLPLGRAVILICALIPGITSILMFRYIGIFIGSVTIALASLLIFGGALMLPRRRESHPASRMW